MPNIASILKEEISRVARKQIKVETNALKRASTKYRSEIAMLKRQVASLQSEVSRLSKKSDRVKPVKAEVASGRRRFSAKGFASQRTRLGLTAEEMGKLLGASGLSVYHWEGGKSRPREKFMPAIAALKTLGKKSAAAVLASR